MHESFATGLQRWEGKGEAKRPSNRLANEPVLVIYILCILDAMSSMLARVLISSKSCMEFAPQVEVPYHEMTFLVLLFLESFYMKSNTLQPPPPPPPPQKKIFSHDFANKVSPPPNTPTHNLPNKKTGPVHCLTYSSTPGTYILTGSSDRSIRLYNPSSTTNTTASSTTSSFSSYITPHQPHHQTLKTDPDKPIYPPTCRIIATYTSHTYAPLTLAVSPQNSHFCSAGTDRGILFWDVAASAHTSSPLRRIGVGPGGHSGRINAVCFAGFSPPKTSPATSSYSSASAAPGTGAAEPSLLASAGFDTTIRLWDLRSPSSSSKPLQILSEAKDSVQDLLVRGHEIIAGSVDGRVRTYDVRTGKLTTDVLGETVTSLCLSRDGNTLLVSSLGGSGSGDGTAVETRQDGGEGGRGRVRGRGEVDSGESGAPIRLLDRTNGTCLRTYRLPGRANPSIRVPSILGGQERWVLAGDEEDWSQQTSSAQTSSSYSQTSPAEAKLHIWDLITGAHLNTLHVPGMAATSTGCHRAKNNNNLSRKNKNVVTCLAWKENGWGDTFAAGGTSGIVTVYGPHGRS